MGSPRSEYRYGLKSRPAYVSVIENFQRVEYVMHNGQPVPYYYEENNMFDNPNMEPNEGPDNERRPGSSLLGDLPPLNVPGGNPGNKFSSHAM